jgi:hypothetical protein
VVYSRPKTEKFCVRGDVLQQMEDKFWSGETTDNTRTGLERRTVTLCGPEGIGKTQVARFYATKNKEKYSSIYWVNAKDELTLAEDCRRILRDQLLKDYSDSKPEDLPALVGKCLSERPDKKWFLIIDNWDDPKVQIENLKSKTSTGHVLILTRRKIDSPNEIFLHELEEEEALSLLLEESETVSKLQPEG